MNTAGAVVNDDLRAYPPGRPSTEQEAAVRRAEARARRIAALPSYAVVWVTAPGARRFGQCDHYAGGRAALVLRADLPASVLERVALHELGHAVAGPSESAAEAFVTEVSMTSTNGIAVLQRSRRDALVREGQALADRAERARRGFTSAERRRADEILAALGGRHPRPMRHHLGCGGTFMSTAWSGASRCARCDVVFFGA